MWGRIFLYMRAYRLGYKALKNGKENSKKKIKSKQAKKKLPWAVQVFFLSIGISAMLSFLSGEALAGAGLIIAFVVLLAFILLGILFDIIGVAVTAADERPFHSMASRKIPGSREALKLIRKANQVSSICNDVVGDICGIVSGSTVAVIVVRLHEVFGMESILTSLAITALASGLTIGGKAVGKTFALDKSTTVLRIVGKFLYFFSRKKR